MDTRNKILTLEDFGRLDLPLTVVATSTSVLRAGFVKELEGLRVPGHALVVALLPAEPELLPARARAEVMAGLRAVDYVIVATTEDLAGFDFISLESSDRERTADLIRRVGQASRPARL